MSSLFRTLVQRPAPTSPPPPAMPAPVWNIPTLCEDDPGQEAYALLGSAWRSSTARLVPTGRHFAVVRTPQTYAVPALAYLRARGARRGAVSAERDRWNFFVPAGRSGSGPWPSWATYISGPAVWVPARSARTDDLTLRWITREPTGQLLTDPAELRSALTTPAPPSPPPTASSAP